MSGVPGVNTFCVLVSRMVSLPRGVFVVPETGLIGVPLVIPADWELFVFLPGLEDFFVLSMKPVAEVFEIRMND